MSIGPKEKRPNNVNWLSGGKKKKRQGRASRLKEEKVDISTKRVGAGRRTEQPKRREKGRKRVFRKESGCRGGGNRQQAKKGERTEANPSPRRCGGEYPLEEGRIVALRGEKTKKENGKATDSPLEYPTGGEKKK